MIRRRSIAGAGAAYAVVFGVCVVSLGGAPQTSRPESARSLVLASADAPVASVHEVLARYCVSCHNGRLQTAGLSLEGVDLEKAGEHAEVLEKAVRKLRTGAMPPQGTPRPDPVTYENLATSLERRLDRAAAAAPNPGRPLPHRMNRAEYANAIRDLLAVDIDPAVLLPRDDSGAGFDNVSDVLGVSPVLLERYLAAAEEISAHAVGDPAVAVSTATYNIGQDLSQNQHIDGLPLGTVGGTLVRHLFPADGDYEIQVRLLRTNLDAMRGLVYPHQVEIAVDGVRALLATVGGTDDLLSIFPARPGEESRARPASDAIDARLRVRLSMRAGPHAVTAAFVQQRPLSTVRLEPFLKSAGNTFDFTGTPHISSLSIAGPFTPRAAEDTPSRRKVFVCRPEPAARAAACATRILSTLARRAYRRPVTSGEVESLVSFYRDERERGGSFDAGIQAGLQRILASPKFVFRVEAEPPGLAPATPYKLDGLALASRLSFFLWSSIPDDELLASGGGGRLGRIAEIERQVRRMLGDPRASALVTNFAGQWLQLRNLQNSVPNSDVFPDVDDNLRRAFRRETELLFESVVREDRSVLDLLRADYTFVNERLARHYGIPHISGSHFRRVPVTSNERRGILGHGSILTVTSHANRTSPVLRGKWILDNLLGTPPPPAPPDVPALAESEEGHPPKSVREQMALHRASPSCASCHKVMDPLGFALENFDAFGAWRTLDAGTPIDASGTLADGSAVDGVVSMREALLSRPEVIVHTMVERLLTYAVGRRLEARDMAAVRAIVRDARREQYRFSSLVRGIVGSAPFQMRMSAPARSDERPVAAAGPPHGPFTRLPTGREGEMAW